MVAFILEGCIPVPMANIKEYNQAKKFKLPSRGSAGLYLYRDSFLGSELKKDIWVGGRCIGETASDVFFYEEVAGGKKHIISTKSEFSPNHLILEAKKGQNYFIRQYIKIGVFVGGSGLELVDPEKGKKLFLN